MGTQHKRPRLAPKLELFERIGSVDVHVSTVVRIRLSARTETAQAFRKGVLSFLSSATVGATQALVVEGATLSCRLVSVNGRRFVLCNEV